MDLCDNIFSLIFIMTRVEKYRKYRREIANMKVDSFSSKKEALEQVEKIRETKSSSVYDYDDLMEVHEIYGKDVENIKSRKRIRVTKYQVCYLLIAIFIIAIIMIATILVGIKVWGK